MNKNHIKINIIKKNRSPRDLAEYIKDQKEDTELGVKPCILKDSTQIKDAVGIIVCGVIYGITNDDLVKLKNKLKEEFQNVNKNNKNLNNNKFIKYLDTINDIQKCIDCKKKRKEKLT